MDTEDPPCCQKFQGICETNPPTSGELKDDTMMDKYYGRMRESYAETAKVNTWKDWKGPKCFEEFIFPICGCKMNQG